MNKLMLKHVLFLLILLALFSCNQEKINEFNAPYIKAGKAKIVGEIVNYSNLKNKAIFVYITVPHPVTGENIQYKVNVDETGTFFTEVELETNRSLCGIYTDINLYHSILIAMEKGKDTHIKILYNTDNNIEKVEVDNVYELTSNDMIFSLEVMNQMIDYRSNNPIERLYDKDPDSFLNYTDKVLVERLKIVNNDSTLTEKAKNIIAKDFTLLMYRFHYFDYEGEMILNYRNTNDGKLPGDNIEINKVGINYYSFLKKLELNDPQYLYCFSFPEFLQTILLNETLNIPRIKEMPIDDWLKEVKSILTNLIGFDNGLFYNLLISNAYSLQFINESKPLSEKQVANIKDYFKNGEIEKILLRKNDGISKLYVEGFKLIVKETPKVSKEVLIDTIISNHKGKVVLIDFWATWCSPCIKSITESKQIKNELKYKDVIFIYITNSSSPRKLWEEKIIGIGGEHYYLNDNEWEYLMDSFNFEGIPAYLIYDKNGVLKQKQISFMGQKNMKKWIDELL